MKNLKLILKKLAIVLLCAIILVGLIGAIIIPILTWDYITTDGSPYALYGYEMEFRYIALFMIAGLLPFGLYGGILIGKYVFKRLQHLSFSFNKQQRIGLIFSGFFILSWGLVIGNNYFPAIHQNLGWVKPEYGPYIQYGTDGSMIISWDTTKKTQSIVKWGSNMNQLDNIAQGGEFINQTGKITYHHAVRVTDLLLGQKYYYQIPGFTSEIYEFTTAPSVDSGKSVVFSIVGDTQYGYRISQKNVALMQQDQEKINFTVIAGDIVHADNNYDEWNQLFSPKSYGAIVAETPLMVATGNHESYCFMLNPDCVPRKNFLANFQNIYPLPSQQLNNYENLGYFYSWNYSNVHMINLDSFNPHGGMLASDQLQWLEEDLARNHNMWKFIYFHVPMYSLMDGNPNMTIINTLQTIFEKYKVDAVFTGHDHVFEAFRVNATYHFLVGGGGGTLEPYDLPKYGAHQWPGNHITVDQLGSGFDDIFAKTWFLEGETSHHYMKVSVNDNHANFTAIRTSDGGIIGTYNSSRNL